MGVGLHLARQLVVEHGGTLWTDPLPGGGTRVAFCIPTMARRAAVATRPRLNPAHGSPQPHWRLSSPSPMLARRGRVRRTLLGITIALVGTGCGAPLTADPPRARRPDRDPVLTEPVHAGDGRRGHGDRSRRLGGPSPRRRRPSEVASWPRRTRIDGVAWTEASPACPRPGSTPPGSACRRTSTTWPPPVRCSRTSPTPTAATPNPAASSSTDDRRSRPGRPREAISSRAAKAPARSGNLDPMGLLRRRAGYSVPFASWASPHRGSTWSWRSRPRASGRRRC